MPFFFFVSFTPYTKEYGLFDVEKRKFSFSRDEVFHEACFPFHFITHDNELTYPFPDLVLPKTLNNIATSTSGTDEHDSSL